MSAYDTTPIAALRLSATQREFIVDHVDGTREIRHIKSEDTTRKALTAMRLVVYVTPENISKRPHATRLTDKGRDVLCAVLANYAERLMRFAFDTEIANPQQSLLREKMLRQMYLLRGFNTTVQQKESKNGESGRRQ